MWQTNFAMDDFWTRSSRPGLIDGEVFALLKYMLKNSDFGSIAKLGPSNFFRAVRVSEVVSVAMQIRANAKAEAKWKKARANVAKAVAPLGVLLDEPLKAENNAQDAEPSDVGSMSPAKGQQILQVFFAQLLGSPSWILDFRPTVWKTHGENGLSWQPSPLFFEPRSDFVDGVRWLYLGYYGDQKDLFNAGIKSLGLGPAENILREHFGLGDQHAVRFDLKNLEKTFGLVFEACAAKRSTIHPEFAAFGLCLLSLYQSLQPTGAEFDVRAAFETASRQMNQH